MVCWTRSNKYLFDLLFHFLRVNDQFGLKFLNQSKIYLMIGFNFISLYETALIWTAFYKR